jgi:hypothetical protein
MRQVAEVGRTERLEISKAMTESLSGDSCFQ